MKRFRMLALAVLVLSAALAFSATQGLQQSFEPTAAGLGRNGP